MSKSDTPLHRIDVSRARDRLTQPAWHGERPIHGFDTETSDGTLFMLSVAADGYEGYTVDNIGDATDGDVTPLSTDRVLDELTKGKFRKGVGVWYNLKFDVDVIFSRLPRRNLKELRLQNRTEYEDYELSYIPGKALTIRRNGQKYEHYDVSQILPGGLNSVADEWLQGRSKLETAEADVERFGDGDYVRENIGAIREYAERDAELTRDVWSAFVEVAEGEVGIPCGRPYSTGYIAADYLRSTLDAKPGWALNSMQQMAWDAYHGGRFEVARRGEVGDSVVPDINSAYPNEMAELPDPSTLVWEMDDDPTADRLREADYGFVEVTVTTDAEKPLQPFAVKIDDAVRYPALDGHRLTVLVDEFLFALDEGMLTDYEIHKAALGSEEEYTLHPYSFVDEMYEKRKTWEDPDTEPYRPKAARVLKIVLNSMYGKTCQTDLRARLLDDDEQMSMEDVNDLPASERFVAAHNGESKVIVRQVGGKLFNPFIAAYITGRTRLELLRRIVEYDLEDATHMLATDSLTIDREAFEATDFADDLVKPGLGNWDYDARGDAFIVGSGVYEVALRNDDGAPLYEPTDGAPDDVGYVAEGSVYASDTRATKTGTRGFREADLDGGLRAAAEEAGDSREIPIENQRPITLNEALNPYSDKYDLTDVARFDKMERTLSSDFDGGRDWSNDEPTYSDLLDGAEESEPLTYDG